MRRTMIIVALLALNLLTATSAVGAEYAGGRVETNVVVPTVVLSTDFTATGFTDLAVGHPARTWAAPSMPSVNVFYSTGHRAAERQPGLLQDLREAGDRLGRHDGGNST